VERRPRDLSLPHLRDLLVRRFLSELHEAVQQLLVAIAPGAPDWRLEEWAAHHKSSMLANMHGSPITNPLTADASPQLSRQHRAMLWQAPPGADPQGFFMEVRI
jgi:hypothetical protein